MEVFWIVGAILVCILIPQGVLGLFNEDDNLDLLKSILIRSIMSIIYLIILLVLFVIHCTEENISFIEEIKEGLNLYKDYKIEVFFKENETSKMYLDKLLIVSVIIIPQMSLLIPRYLFNKAKEAANYTEEDGYVTTYSIRTDAIDGKQIYSRTDKAYTKPYLWITVVLIILYIIAFLLLFDVIMRFIPIVYVIAIIIFINVAIIVAIVVIKKYNKNHYKF